MPQLGNFAARPRQDKLRFFLPFWAWIRLELFTGQRSRSGEICHRVFVVVNFIQRAGHEARSFFFFSVVIGLRAKHTSARRCFGKFPLVSPPPPPPPSTKRLISSLESTVHFLLSITLIRFFPAAACHGPLERCRDRLTGSRPPCSVVRSLRFTDSTSSGLICRN